MRVLRGYSCTEPGSRQKGSGWCGGQWERPSRSSALQHLPSRPDSQVKPIADRPTWTLVSINPLTPSGSPPYADPDEYGCGLSASFPLTSVIMVGPPLQLRHGAFSVDLSCGCGSCRPPPQMVRQRRRWLRSALNVGMARSYFSLRTEVAR